MSEVGNLILARFPEIPGRCHVSGYSAPWFPVVSVAFGASKRSAWAVDDEEQVAGSTKLSEMELKKPTDATTSAFMFASMKGTVFKSAEFHYVGVAQRTRVTPFLMLEFGDLYISEWDFDSKSSSEPTETIKFKYRKMAMLQQYTKDGSSMMQSTARGWDITPKKAGSWTPEFKLPSEE